VFLPNIKQSLKERNFSKKMKSPRNASKSIAKQAIIAEHTVIEEVEISFLKKLPNI
jgi:hypothetical protein